MSDLPNADLPDADPPSSEAPDRTPSVSRSLLRADMSDRQLESSMIAKLERALGHPERHTVEAGTILLREGEYPDGISVVIDGRIEIVRPTPDGDLVLHAASAGRIVGLVLLTRSGRASFTVRTATRVTLLPVRFADLEQALRADAELADDFLNVLIRSLSRRHHRAVELQIENIRLAESLAEDRDRLEEALAKLEAAQAQVVQSARMATLGEMAAGLAHELNNPVAALSRAVAYVAEDVTGIVADGPQGARRAELLERAMSRPPRSTSDHRRLRAELEDAVGDRGLAERLLGAGVETREEARRIVADTSGDPDELLDELTRLRRLGEAVRNVRSAAERITGLVSSLRAYARSGDGFEPGVDVREGLDETLHLLAHRLDGVEVSRGYDDVPEITANPGELNQVWTNLVVNALEAMGESGRLDVRVRPHGDGVEVAVTDSGPGIAPQDLDRVFEPHFTTKHGRITYGLGLGLAICRQIVGHHGGTIEAASEPGRTTMTVRLPRRPPDPHAEERWGGAPAPAPDDPGGGAPAPGHDDPGGGGPAPAPDDPGREQPG